MGSYYMNLEPKNNKYSKMDDEGYTASLRKVDVKAQKLETGKMSKDINIYDSIYHSNNMRRLRSDIYDQTALGGRLFTSTFRFGLMNPYGAISSAKEFLFFTKPDLHIACEDIYGNFTGTLNKGLNTYFWKDLGDTKQRIICALQKSYLNNSDPFNHLLQNTVSSNLDVPSLNAPSIETSTNTFGVSLSYRGSSEESDDGPEFSLEFRDDRYLNVYTFFRAYEEYETAKKHGTVAPQRRYLKNKIIHDQFAIFKFIVDEDMETILYWGKYYGVYPTSLPRDAFNSANFQDGLTFSINFKAAFYEDMRPEILQDFNAIAKEPFDAAKYRLDIYNNGTDRADGRAAKAAYVYKVVSDPRATQNPNGFYYKLAWRGDDVV